MESIATSVFIFATIGAFIDFYIGKPGQKAIKARLEHIWLTIGYMSIHDLARHEANFSVSVLKNIFGNQIFSRKRLFSLIVVYSFTWLYIASLSLHAARQSTSAVVIAVFLIRSGISLSISIFLAQRIANGISRNVIANFLLLALLAFVQVLILLSPVAMQNYMHADSFRWMHDPVSNLIGNSIFPVRRFVKGYFTGEFVEQALFFFSNLYEETLLFFYGIYRALLDFPPLFASSFTWGDTFACRIVHHKVEGFDDVVVTYGGGCAETVIGCLRLVLLFLFILTYALYPFRSIIMNIWLRVIESDKPVFTLVAGGATALIKSIQELAKIL